MHRIIDGISLEITTACNRRCPECCCGMGRRPVVHHPWEYFVNLARFTDGIDCIHVAGGEPLTHPKFSEFVAKFRELFGCRKLTLWTNGFHAHEYAATLKHFDTIYATRYGGDNAPEIDFLVSRFGAQACDADHVPLSQRGNGKPCARGSWLTMAAYADGRFFPCCVGPGIAGAESLAPCPDWRTRILNVPMPCGECCFSE